MSIIGKIHEISLYGVISTIICLVEQKVSIKSLWEAAFHPEGIQMIFQCYMFWATVLFVPIAILCALYTKYVDGGEGLTFHSNNFFVIIFAHIAEELLGLFLTPIWFLRDLFKRDFDEWKIVDYALYALELIIISIGIIIVL